MAGKSLLIIISSAPYNGTDNVWNAMRLAQTSVKNGTATRIFLINNGVDAGRSGLQPPENYFNLADMLKETAEQGVEVKYCKTCIDRCGIGTGDMIGEIAAGSMQLLYDWTMSSDKVVTF
ncbi:MAG: DsrE family protein [Nitrospinae bacterium]|nr:DsrE family protein [Nitrospinota bacterium]